MARFTYASALPVSGAAADLLTAAMARDFPVTLKTLAEDAGISTFAASRAAGDLLAAGLILGDRSEGFVFNWDHEQARELARLAWRYSGVRRPYNPVFPSIDASSPAQPWLDLVPDAIGLPAGPNLLQTRDHADQIGEVVNRMGEIRTISQEVFRQWRDERLRDVIHLSIELGGSALMAARHLASAADSHTQGDADPRQVSVAGTPWVRATLMVNAEAHTLQSALIPLVKGAAVGAAMRGHRRRALALADDAARLSKTRPHDALSALTGIAAEISAADDLLWNRDHGQDRQPFHHLGGTPAQDEVGTSGDMVLAVRAQAALEDLVEILDVMATQAPVTQWQQQHPELARDYPLLLEIPTLAERCELYRPAAAGAVR